MAPNGVTESQYVKLDAYEANHNEPKAYEIVHMLTLKYIVSLRYLWLYKAFIKKCIMAGTYDIPRISM